jgi:hypothetical protein
MIMNEKNSSGFLGINSIFGIKSTGDIHSIMDVPIIGQIMTAIQKTGLINFDLNASPQFRQVIIPAFNIMLSTAEAVAAALPGLNTILVPLVAAVGGGEELIIKQGIDQYNVNVYRKNINEQLAARQADIDYLKLVEEQAQGTGKDQITKSLQILEAEKIKMILLYTAGGIVVGAVIYNIFKGSNK